MKTCLIMRGLPGSGKSTWIKRAYPKAVKATQESVTKAAQVICSADHWFERSGVYVWNPRELPEAHDFCKNMAQKAMAFGAQTVIIDNTNTQPWEWEIYRETARLYNYMVVYMSLFDAGLSDHALASRNVHNVPVSVIARMRSRWARTP